MAMKIPMKSSVFALFFVLCEVFCNFANSQSMPDYSLILQDIYLGLVEDGEDVDFEELTEQLSFLHDNPINLNRTNADELSRLSFLSERQIDDILLYAYQHPFSSLYELQLIRSLPSYVVRNMLPFVYVGESKEKPFYVSDLLKFAKQELTVRTDVRDIEARQKDPVYLSVKYRYDYGKKVQFGFQAEHDAGDKWYVPRKTYGFDFYGGYLQLNDVKFLKRLVLGDFHAQFGMGLTLNTNFRMGGKQAILHSLDLRQKGLQKKGSTSEYKFLRGVGVVLKLKNVDLSVLYSGRKIDANVQKGSFSSIISTGYHTDSAELSHKRSEWQHVVATDVTYTRKYLQVGMTAVAHFLQDTLSPSLTYYNSAYFHGKRQFSVGSHFRFHYRKVSVFGELTFASNKRWGVGGIIGTSIMPIRNFSLYAIYRYYSVHFDNLLGNAFGELSRQNAEQGFYLGVSTDRIRHLRLNFYADLFAFRMAKSGSRVPSVGSDIFAEAVWDINRDLQFSSRLSWKDKFGQHKADCRLRLTYSTRDWRFSSDFIGNFVKGDSLSFGVLLSEDMQFRLPVLPMVFSLRFEAFYAPQFDNRFYLYENDVLYAFSIPMQYGIGARYYLNWRYKVTKWLSLYLRFSQTAYSPWYARQKNIRSRTTDIHTTVRFTF